MHSWTRFASKTCKKMTFRLPYFESHFLLSLGIQLYEVKKKNLTVPWNTRCGKAYMITFGRFRNRFRNRKFSPFYKLSIGFCIKGIHVPAFGIPSQFLSLWSSQELTRTLSVKEVYLLVEVIQVSYYLIPCFLPAMAKPWNLRF